MNTTRSRPRRAARCAGYVGWVRYRSHEDATRALTWLRRLGPDDIPRRAYRCPRCAGWHLARGAAPSKQDATVGRGPS